MWVEPTRAQQEVCERAAVEPDAPPADAKLGLGSMDDLPVNGLRHAPEAGASGWFIWAGGEIDQTDPSYFRPVHVAHLGRLHPEVAPYLALPPGWRFQIAPGHEDVWYDATLLAL
jgi:hypothetical protein